MNAKINCHPFANRLNDCANLYPLKNTKPGTTVFLRPSIAYSIKFRELRSTRTGELAAHNDVCIIVNTCTVAHTRSHSRSTSSQQVALVFVFRDHNMLRGNERVSGSMLHTSCWFTILQGFVNDVTMTHTAIHRRVTYFLVPYPQMTWHH